MVCGLFFLIVLFGSWLAGQTSSDHVMGRGWRELKVQSQDPTCESIDLELLPNSARGCVTFSEPANPSLKACFHWRFLLGFQAQFHGVNYWWFRGDFNRQKFTQAIRNRRENCQCKRALRPAHVGPERRVSDLNRKFQCHLLRIKASLPNHGSQHEKQLKNFNS